MLWQVSFNGRTAGAIGITYPITDTVEADTEEEARLKLYDKYEHITQFKAQPASKAEDQGQQ